MYLTGIAACSIGKNVPFVKLSIVKYTVPDTEFAPIKE